jgi:hypothetical protein
MLRDILLIARPPLLAVMQGGECAAPKRLGILFRVPMSFPRIFVKVPSNGKDFLRALR